MIGVRRSAVGLVCLTVLSSSAGCKYIQRGVARTSEVIPAAEIVVERVNRYIDADPALSESRKLGLKAQGEALLVLLNSQELVELDRLESQQLIVIGRHDQYVRDDESLSEKQKRRYLRTTDIMRRLVQIDGEGSDS